MEKIIDLIQNQVLNNFDFSFTFIVNVLTYILIKIIDYLNGNRKVNIWCKRLVLVEVIIIFTIVYHLLGYNNNIRLLNSAILSPVAWSWIFKPICAFLKIDYKEIDDTLKS